MTDLRKAAEMALDALDCLPWQASPIAREATKALRTALSQHECSRSHPHENMDSMCELRTENARLTNENARLKKALAQPEQEPVCFLRETAWSYEIAHWDDPKGFPVYTAPPKREWVGLTKEDMPDED